MNTQTQEALKMAQEVLNLYCEQLNSKFANDALKAIDEALAQPTQEPSRLTFEQLNTPFGIYSTPLDTHPAPTIVQEPDAWMDSLGNVMSKKKKIETKGSVGDAYKIPLYDHPAPAQEYLWDGQLDNAIIIRKKKEWQSLSDDEMKSFMDVWGITKMAIQDLEASFKEKNK